MSALIVLAGATAGLGVSLIAAGFIAPSPAGARTPRWRPTASQLIPPGIGGLAGAVVVAVTGWPAAGAGAGLLTGIATAGIVGQRHRPQVVDTRLEGIANWCEQLRDLLRAGALLGPAISTTAVTAPLPVRPAVLSLAARLEREHPREALRRLADDLDDPTGDLVASVLLTATSHAGNTAELLTELADVTRQRVERRKAIETERATTRMDMRIVLGVVTCAVIGLLVFSRSQFFHPYRTATGQLVLAGVFGLFIAAMVWARRLATYRRPARFLTITHPGGER